MTTEIAIRYCDEYLERHISDIDKEFLKIAKEALQQEPKTGHWIFDEVLDRHYYCSECKSMGVDYWDYCPNCGAKMESEDKE